MHPSGPGGCFLVCGSPGSAVPESPNELEAAPDADPALLSISVCYSIGLLVQSQ